MSRQRHGFTLVELLVVIAIIGILIALLLPAVQAAREAARRSQCSNNLKQLALGLHNYESTYKRFPPAGKGYGWCPASATSEAEIWNSNGLVELLPYIEQQALYEQFNHKVAFAILAGAAHRNTTGTHATDPANPAATQNFAIMRTILPAFICPSDGTNANDRLLSGAHYGPQSGFVGTATNYDFITSQSDFSVCNYWKNAGSNQRMFGENSTTNPGNVLDGLSNTFMMGETTKWHVNGAAFAWAYRTWVMTGVDPSNPTDGGINRWHLPHVHPTWQNPPYTPVAGRIRTWWSAAGSLHPGGCQFAMGDGSVRFVREQTSITVMGAMARMKDGTVASLD